MNGQGKKAWYVLSDLAATLALKGGTAPEAEQILLSVAQQ